MSVRLRRLQAEYERLKSMFSKHERIQILEAVGDPPERYVIEYRVRGLVDGKEGIKEQGVHKAQITLGPNYPKERPRCEMLTPVFHPNIDHMAICTEDIGAAGQTLDQTIIFIGEMLTYQAYNIQSPRNGEAARWLLENRDRLPLEKVDLMPSTLLESSLAKQVGVFSDVLQKDEETQIHAEAAERQPAQKCSNCGGYGPDAELQLCLNTHLVCSDCVVSCKDCKGILCVLCELKACERCREHVCRECIAACDGCGLNFCAEHLARCSACRCTQCCGCSVSCAQCGDVFCPAHLDEASRCPNCRLLAPRGKHNLEQPVTEWQATLTGTETQKLEFEGTDLLYEPKNGEAVGVSEPDIVITKEELRVRDTTESRPLLSSVGIRTEKMTGSRWNLFGVVGIAVLLQALLVWGIIWYGARSESTQTTSLPQVKIDSLMLHADKGELRPNEAVLLKIKAKHSDGTEGEVKDGIEWQTTDEKIVSVNSEGRAEGQKEGYADITARYKGLVSEPLTLVVKGSQLRPEPLAQPQPSGAEPPPISNVVKRKVLADKVKPVTAKDGKVKDHLLIGGFCLDRGDYSCAVSEFEIARSIDPQNKQALNNLDRARTAWDGEKRVLEQVQRR